jgi:hypothetical protein
VISGMEPPCYSIRASIRPTITNGRPAESSKRPLFVENATKLWEVGTPLTHNSLANSTKYHRLWHRTSGTHARKRTAKSGTTSLATELITTFAESQSKTSHYLNHYSTKKGLVFCPTMHAGRPKETKLRARKSRDAAC